MSIVSKNGLNKRIFIYVVGVPYVLSTCSTEEFLRLLACLPLGSVRFSLSYIYAFFIVGEEKGTRRKYFFSNPSRVSHPILLLPLLLISTTFFTSLHSLRLPYKSKWNYSSCYSQGHPAPWQWNELKISNKYVRQQPAIHFMTQTESLSAFRQVGLT